MLAGVLMPIRPVVPLDEGRVDRAAHRRTSQIRLQQGAGPEDHAPHYLHDPPLLAPLPYGRVAQALRQGLHGLGRAARPRTPRLRSLDAIDLSDGRLVRGMLVAGDQEIGPPPGPVVDLLHDLLAGRAVPLAGHQAQQESTLGIDRGVVPIVTPPPIPRVERIAPPLLLVDEAPLLIELDFPGLGGKTPRA